MPLGTLDRQYAFTGWAAGSDSIVGLIWTLYFFTLTERDQLCGTTPGLDGTSSGADGEPCQMGFNATNFLLYGGGACRAPDSPIDAPRYVHDAALPGCSEALARYRAATSPAFTCDCDGDYAFLGGTGGLRSDVLWTSVNSLSFATLCVLGPIVGTIIDFQGGKCVWWLLTGLTSVGLVGMAVIGNNFLWAVGLTFQFLAAVSSDLNTIPRQAYLEDVRPTSAGETMQMAVARVSANRVILSYACQFVLVLFGLVLISVFTAPVPAIIIAIVGGLWYGGFSLFVMSKIHSRPATRERNGRTVCQAAFGELLTDFKALLREHPEGVKYLLFLFLAQNGGGTTLLSVSNPYLIEGPPKANIIQVFSIFLTVLVFGMLWLIFFARVVSRRISYKKILLIILCLNITGQLLTGFVFVTPFAGYSKSYFSFLASGALIVAPSLTWYFAVYWPAFMILIPTAQVNQYSGIFTFVRTFGLIWHSGPIYSACVSSLSSAVAGHRLGVLTMIGWNLLAIPFLLWVDFDKGRREAGRAETEEGPKLQHAASADDGHELQARA